MARLLPSDISELSLSLGETVELRTLETLRSGLPSTYTVFHSVHWSRDAAYQTTFGKADFIVVNQSGEVVVIEQKSGALEESADGLIKRYPDRRKNVATQVHRTLDGIRDQFKRQSGHDIVLAAKGAFDPTRFALVPVRPDWIDNQSILGFVNPITNSYESTQALDLILRAKRAIDQASKSSDAPR